MSVTQLLDDLAQQNIKIDADGEQLAVRAPRGAMTPVLRERLAQHKGELLALLRQTIDAEKSPLPEKVIPDPGARYEPFPLTDIQQAYWVGRRPEFAHGGVSIHFYAEIDGVGLDLPRLEAAWRRMIERHDMLRAVILPDGRQQILETVPEFRFAVVDLRDRTGAEVEVTRSALREELSHQVLPNDRWPAFDIRVSMAPGDRARLHLSIDLISVDGGSLTLLMDEWTRAYADPALSLEPLTLSYRDYVLGELATRRSPAYERSFEYWKERVGSLPPAPDLPLAAGDGGTGRPRFVHKERRLERAAWERLKRRAAARDLTGATVLATAFAETMATWSKEKQFTLNVTLFNRLSIHEQVDQILGDFTSMLLVSVDAGGRVAFADRARAIQGQLWRDLEHHTVSGVQVLRELAKARDSYDSALMPIVFTNMLNLSGKGLTPIYTSLERLGTLAFVITQTPQVWLDCQVHEDAQGVRLTWDVVEALFPPGMLDDMLSACHGLLQRLADEEAVWDESIALAPRGQLEQRTAINLATDAPIPDSLLHELFVAHAEKQPGHPAVICEDGETLSYGDVDRRARALATRLRSMGVGANTLVAVVMDRSWEQVVAVLGVQMAGGAYVPMDPASPVERLRYLFEQSGARIALTQSWLKTKIEWPSAAEVVAVDAAAPGEAPVGPLPRVQSPGDLAYVIYTSGSTGLPKGVVIEQQSVVNRILDVNERWGLGPHDRCLALSALHHDLSVYDIFGLLAAGGTIVMPAADAQREPWRWAELMKREQVTVWNSVPPFLEMLVEHLDGREDASPIAGLRYVILAGDWIAVTLPDRLRKLAPQAQVIGSGGATETTIWDVWYPIGEVDPSWKSIPYGQPMRNARYYVLDKALKNCPVWVPGEIHMSGVGVARGYWRDEAKTAAAFIVHPDTKERLYRSGDLGRYLPDGNVEFLGREDTQVKIGGVRIELEEIEAALARHPQVRSCAVVAQGQPRGARWLAAFVVPQKVTEAPPPVPAPPPTADEGLAEAAETIEFKLRRPGLRRDLDDRPATPLPALTVEREMLQASRRRRTHRAFSKEPIAYDALAYVLEGLKGSESPSGFQRFLYPSAGTLYPVQVYLHVNEGRVSGLDGGSYYYHPFEHALRLLSREPIARSIHAAVNQAAHESSAFSLFLVARLDAIQPLYGELARDLCLLEAGYMSQLLCSLAAEADLALCPIGGLDFAGLGARLRLEPNQALLHSHVGGRPTALAATGIGGSAEGLSGDVLNAFLTGKLPDALRPAVYQIVDSLPLTANGKIDRRALVASKDAARPPQEASATPGGSKGDKGELKDKIAKIVASVLGHEQVDPTANYFHLGATSVHLVRIAAQVRQIIGREVPVIELFRHPSVTALTALLSKAEAPRNGTPPGDAEARARIEARRAARAGRGRSVK